MSTISMHYISRPYIKWNLMESITNILTAKISNVLIASNPKLENFYLYCRHMPMPILRCHKVELATNNNYIYNLKHIIYNVVVLCFAHSLFYIFSCFIY